MYFLFKYILQFNQQVQSILTSEVQILYAFYLAQNCNLIYLKL